MSALYFCQNMEMEKYGNGKIWKGWKKLVAWGASDSTGTRREAWAEMGTWEGLGGHGKNYSLTRLAFGRTCSTPKRHQGAR